MGGGGGAGGGGEFTILFLEVYICTYYPTRAEAVRFSLSELACEQ